MTATVRAVYQGGVFRPAEPLLLADGTAVELAVTAPDPPPVSDVEAERRAEAVRRLSAFWAEIAADAADEPDDGYDILEALACNREYSGWVPPPPAPEAGRE